MKKPLLIKIMVVFGALGVYSCSPNQLAQTGEYDDLYFTSADRNAVAVQTGAVATQPSRSAVSESDFKRNGEINYEQENFSSKTVNPDYISRYNAQNSEAPISADDQNFTSDEFTDNDQEYFVEDYNANNNNELNRNTARNAGFNNYYGRGMGMGMGMGMMGMGFYDPFMMGMYDPFMMGMYDPFMMGMYDPFWRSRMFMRPGIHVGIGFGMGFGWNRWNRWGMGGMGFYDPFWGPGFYNPWSPWGMGWGMGGFNRGIMYTNIHNYYYDGNSPMRNTRTVVSGPRASRNALVGATTTPMRSRATTNETVGRRTETASAATAQRQASTLQNNYYNRSRSYITEQPVGRSASEINSRNADRTTVSRAETVRRDADYYSSNRNVTRPGTEYNRNSTPARGEQYRTSSPNRGNTQYRTTSPSRSNTDYYRSAPSRSSSPQYNAPSRSSTPQYRSAPSTSPSRSSGSFGGGGFSSPSRGSGGGGGIPSRR
jgi:hypothetical protein